MSHEQMPLLKPTPAGHIPQWRIKAFGPPLAFHDARCWLDPLHLRETPCDWPVERAHPIGGDDV